MTFKFSFMSAPTTAKAANQLTEEVSGTAAVAGEEGWKPFLPLVSWSSRTIDRFERRRRRFIDLGLSDGEALAERLALRDQEGDERILCVECIHHRTSGCAKRGLWLPRQLQRCDTFEAGIESPQREAA